MSTQESLSLPDGFEHAHPSLPDAGSLMRLFCSIILVLFSAVDRPWNQLAMSDAIAT
jgi:hypothetical protein